MDSKSYYDEGGTFRFETENMRAYIGDDGRIHVVADPDSMTQQLAGLDLERARTLTQVGHGGRGGPQQARGRPGSRARYCILKGQGVERVLGLDPAHSSSSTPSTLSLRRHTSG